MPELNYVLIGAGAFVAFVSLLLIGVSELVLRSEGAEGGGDEGYYRGYAIVAFIGMLLVGIGLSRLGMLQPSEVPILKWCLRIVGWFSFLLCAASWYAALHKSEQHAISSVKERRTLLTVTTLLALLGAAFLGYASRL